MTTRRDFVTAVPAAASAALVVGSGAVTTPARAAASAADPEAALVHARAVEAMIWGMPAVNLALMYEAMLRVTPGRVNQMLYWSKLLDWKCQTLTPNPDVIYLTPYFDTRDVGPIVLEIPPADDGVINGTIMDAWQMPLEDVGPAGVDAGKGGKYLVLPPGYDAKQAPAGHVVLPCLTHSSYALLRSILRSGSEADHAKAVAYARRIRIYPLSQAANPPATAFVDASGVLYDATIPYDARFFEVLDRVVQSQPWLQRDRAMIDKLRTIGIEKGKAFSPDEGRRKVYDAAAKEVLALLSARYDELFETPYAPGSRWTFPSSPEFLKAVQSHFEDPDHYPTDFRGLLFTYIFFTPKRLGEGQFYLMNIADKSGATLDGSKRYRLNVPANAPVRQYWSATVYDRRTHALVKEVPRAGRSSQSPGLQKNKDGSVDLWFGPSAPRGKEPNWVSTRADGQFEVLFRFYGPLPPLFDKTWALTDIEPV